MVDNWLDVFDAYDEDASAASFFMAAEAAAVPNDRGKYGIAQAVPPLD